MFFFAVHFTHFSNPELSIPESFMNIMYMCINTWGSWAPGTLHVHVHHLNYYTCLDPFLMDDYGVVHWGQGLFYQFQCFCDGLA